MPWHGVICVPVARGLWGYVEPTTVAVAPQSWVSNIRVPLAHWLLPLWLLVRVGGAVCWVTDCVAGAFVGGGVLLVWEVCVTKFVKIA